MIGDLFYTFYRYAALTQVTGKIKNVFTEYDLPCGTSRLEIFAILSRKIMDVKSHNILIRTIQFDANGNLNEKSFFRISMVNRESKYSTTFKYTWSGDALERIDYIRDSGTTKTQFFHSDNGTKYEIEPDMLSYRKISRINNTKIKVSCKDNEKHFCSIWEFHSDSTTLVISSCNTNEVYEKVIFNKTGKQSQLHIFSPTGVEKYHYIYTDSDELEEIKHFEGEKLVDGIFIQRFKGLNEWYIFERVYGENEEINKNEISCIYKFFSSKKLNEI